MAGNPGNAWRHSERHPATWPGPVLRWLVITVVLASACAEVNRPPPPAPREPAPGMGQPAPTYGMSTMANFWGGTAQAYCGRVNLAVPFGAGTEHAQGTGPSTGKETSPGPEQGNPASSRSTPQTAESSMNPGSESPPDPELRICEPTQSPCGQTPVRQAHRSDPRTTGATGTSHRPIPPPGGENSATAALPRQNR